MGKKSKSWIPMEDDFEDDGFPCDDDSCKYGDVTIRGNVLFTENIITALEHLLFIRKAPEGGTLYHFTDGTEITVQDDFREVWNCWTMYQNN